MSTPPARPTHQRWDDVPREPRALAHPGDAIVLSNEPTRLSLFWPGIGLGVGSLSYGIWLIVISTALLEFLSAGALIAFGSGALILAARHLRKTEARLYWQGMTQHVLESGIAVKGTLVRKGRRVYARYQPPCSTRPLDLRLTAGVAERASVLIGQENAVDVVCHPDYPQDALCTTVLGVRFDAQPVIDTRDRTDFAAEPPPEPPTRISLTLHNALAYLDTTPSFRLWHRFKRSKPSKGTLMLADTRLTQDTTRPIAQLDLAQTFRVNLSVWPVSPTTAEVNVTLRQRGAPPSTLPIAFKVGLPQTALSIELPIKRTYTPLMARSDFGRLWQALRYYSQHHGDTLDRMLHAPSINPRRYSP